jgi:hypothetical protein
LGGRGGGRAGGLLGRPVARVASVGRPARASRTGPLPLPAHAPGLASCPPHARVKGGPLSRLSLGASRPPTTWGVITPEGIVSSLLWLPAAGDVTLRRRGRARMRTGRVHQGLASPPVPVPARLGDSLPGEGVRPGVSVHQRGLRPALARRGRGGGQEDCGGQRRAPSQQRHGRAVMRHPA